MAGTLRNFRNDSIFNRQQGSLTGTYTAATDVLTASGAGTGASLTNPNGVAGVGGAGAALAAGVLTLTPGFVPKFVRVVNVTDRISWEWFAGMNQGDYLEQVAAGTRTLETDDKLVILTTTGVTTITLTDLSVGDNDSMTWVVEG